MPPFECDIPLLRAAVWSEEALPCLRAGGFADVATGAPDVAFVDPLVRRRLSRVGRGQLHAAGRAAGLGGEDPGPLRSVFASQHGDPARTMPILADLTQGQEASPMNFSMNVHNAVAGIWSIVRRDRSPSISVAAGPETFGWGLLEALAIHRAEGAPVLFVYGDDRLPESLASFEPVEAPLHAAALLVGGPAARTLRLRLDPSAALEPFEAPDRRSQSLHVLEALGGAETGPWRGRGGAWSWRLA